MLRRLGIRGKVLAALGVPVLVLVLLAGLVSWQSVQQVRTAQTVTALLDAVAESGAVLTALQSERAASLPYATGSAAPEAQAAVDAARAATTAALADLDAALGATDLTTLDPAVSAGVTGLRTDLAALTDVRALVDTRAAAAVDVVAGFSGVIDATVALPATVADGLADRGLAATLTASFATSALAESYAEEQALGVATLDGDRSAASLQQLSGLSGGTAVAFEQASTRVAQLGAGLTVPPLGASDNGVTSFDVFRAMVATGDPGATAGFTSADWSAAAEAEILALAPVRAALHDAAVTDAAATSAAALRTSLITLGAALAAVLLSVVTALVVARQIIRPLRRLTEAVGAVRAELPRLVEEVAVPGQGPDLALAQIPVTSNDEIGRLAAAFNDVNATTIQVAQEQAALRGSIAEMFVNVARRDQVLLNRQLTFIDALERSEENPRVLADLFRLDHLATRMRRNAESLLVLAGIDTGRRLRDTLPLSDVIRTASSEIEHYERVMLDLPVDPMMLGHTALPAAHLLAELLENATMFSEPGTPVHVSTGIDETHVLVTVLDQGLGMTPDELESAHAKIRSSSAGEVLGAQRLGMFVVGRIAVRLNAQVELAIGPYGTGTQAIVRLPLVLFTDVADLPVTPPTVPAAVLGHGPSARSLQTGPVGRATPAPGLDDADAGAPRRRSRTAEATPTPPSARTAASMPLAPTAESLAGAAAAEIDPWTPPVVEENAPLTRRRVAQLAQLAEEAAAARDHAEASLRTPEVPLPALVEDELEPEVALPARTRGEVAPPPAPAPTAPPATEGRSAMFTGFRSRRGAAAAADAPAVDEARHDDDPVAPVAPAGLPVMVVPTLVDDAPWSVTDAPVDAAGHLVVPLLAEEDDDELWLPAAAPSDAPSAAVVEPDDASWAAPVAPFVAQPAAVVAPAPVVVDEPAAEADEPWLPVVPESIENPWPAPADTAPDFAALVHGPTAKAAKQRKGLFGRRRPAPAAPVVVTPGALPAAPAGAAAPLPVADATSTVAPVRQSAWGTSEAGAHAWTEPAAAPVIESFAAALDLPPALPVVVPPVPPVDLPPAPHVAVAPVLAPPAPPAIAPAQPAGLSAWLPDPDGLAAVAEAFPTWRRPAPTLPTDATPAVVEPVPAPVAEAVPTSHAAEAAPFAAATSFPVPPSAAASVPSQHTPSARSTTFTPQSGIGAMDSPSHQLAQRADIAQQALAELSQLSSYRPQAADAAAAPLTRRTPAAVPTVPPIATTRAGARTSRDADQVRSLLSSFQSGTSRGREAADAGAPAAGPDGTPLTTDVDQRSTSW